MTDTNRTQLAAVRESTLGVTPTTPRMRAFRGTGEGLFYRPQFTMSEELRDDRMTADPIKVGEETGGPVNVEMHFPQQDSILRGFFESLFFGASVNTPSRDNDGVADSVITDVANSTQTVTVTNPAGGGTYAIGHLVRHTGFGQAANNGLFRVSTGGSTSYICAGAGMANETAPAAAARSKVVGFQGASGDITATATGLGSTALDFTTLGLAVGQWIKIGGTGAAFQFNTGLLNTWARITAIAATALTLDNLPPGWTTDAGTGKTIRVFFGDRLRNGTTQSSHTIERGFLGQSTPTYISQVGQVAMQGEFRFEKKRPITGSFTFMGLGGAESTTTLDASVDPAPSIASFPIFAGSADVGRVAEAGAQLTTPNWCSSIALSINNNGRMIEALDSVAAVDVGEGECAVSAQLMTYFGSRALYTKLLAGTPTSLSWRVVKANRAMVFGIPRGTMVEGSPNAQAKNQDVMLTTRVQASRDDLTGAHVTLDMLEYVE